MGLGSGLGLGLGAGFGFSFSWMVAHLLWHEAQRLEQTETERDRGQHARGDIARQVATVDGSPRCGGAALASAFAHAPFASLHAVSATLHAAHRAAAAAAALAAAALAAAAAVLLGRREVDVQHIVALARAAGQHLRRAGGGVLWGGGAVQ